MPYANTPEGRAKRLIVSARYRTSPKGRAYHKQWRQEHPEYCKAKNRRLAWELKVQALQAYGGPEPRCACCGESNLGFLTLDHVNGDGASHRRSITGGKNFCGQKMMRWLRQRGWPTDPPIQVLCHNCNSGRQSNGGICPHIKLLTGGELRAENVRRA